MVNVFGTTRRAKAGTRRWWSGILLAVDMYPKKKSYAIAKGTPHEKASIYKIFYYDHFSAHLVFTITQLFLQYADYIELDRGFQTDRSYACRAHAVWDF
tara:strand:+ start:2606 stop:2902 length:297 start_codon:yes stop_codon:yes gene_type:complete